MKIDTSEETFGYALCIVGMIVAMMADAQFSMTEPVVRWNNFLLLSVMPLYLMLLLVNLG